MSKHLTLTDRAIIEKYLAQDMSFSFIAKRLNRSATTISREIKNHRCFVNGFRYTSNDCINYRSCLRRNICDQESIYTCSHRCKTCTEFDCKSLCSQYISAHCPLLDKPPYVCTRCPNEKTCKRNHAYYTAHRAHAEYVKELSSSRKGIRTSPERLLELNDLLMPLVNKGQSINHIFATHSDEIRLSKKTIYNYIDQSAFRVRNIDLPKKVRYKQRHSHEVLMKFDYQYRKGRTYTDFTSFMEQNPKLPIVEMDTVIGQRDKKNCLLVLSERKTRTEIIRKIKSKSQDAVKAALDQIEKDLGSDQFRTRFKSITTDNGVEFLDAGKIETSINGGKRTISYYCHPYSSWERGTNENINKMIRRWIPKGADITLYTDQQIAYIEHWINAFPRKIFNFKSSRDMLRVELRE